MNSIGSFGRAELSRRVPIGDVVKSGAGSGPVARPWDGNSHCVSYWFVPAEVGGGLLLWGGGGGGGGEERKGGGKEAKRRPKGECPTRDEGREGGGWW